MRYKNRGPYKISSYPYLVCLQLMMGDKQLTDSDGMLSTIEEKVEKEYVLSNLSKETADILNMLLNAPTEFLDEAFGTKTLKRYNKKRIVAWLKKAAGKTKYKKVLHELKQIAELQCR